MQSKELDVDEDLPNFYKSLTRSDAFSLSAANKRMQAAYGFETQDPDTIEALDEVKTLPLRSMQGTPWYHVLSNPMYTTQFNYIGESVDEREKIIENGKPDEWVEDFKRSDGEIVYKLSDACTYKRLQQSDFVYIMFNLAYIPDEVIMQVNFDTPGEWGPTFRAAMKEYKVKWERDCAKQECRKWKFQDGHLENFYKQHMEKAEMVNDPGTRASVKIRGSPPKTSPAKKFDE